MLRDYSKGLLVILGLASLFGTGTAVTAQDRSFPQATKIADNSFSAANQYLVYVPNADPTTVQQVKAIAPEAFRSQLDSGQAIVQIGRFNNLNLAQRRIEELKTSGVTAQVTQVSTRLPSAPSTPNSFPTATPPIPQSGIPATAPTGIPNNDGIATLPGVPSTPDINNTTNSTIDISRPGQTGQPVPIPTSPAPNTTAAINPPPTLSRNRYYVIVPSSVDTVLAKVRNLVPTARLTASERGTYIEVQGFPDRGSAEALNTNMRSQGLDSRVIYF